MPDKAKKVSDMNETQLVFIATHLLSLDENESVKEINIGTTSNELIIANSEVTISKIFSSIPFSKLKWKNKLT